MQSFISKSSMLSHKSIWQFARKITLGVRRRLLISSRRRGPRGRKARKARQGKTLKFMLKVAAALFLMLSSSFAFFNYKI